MSGFSNLMTTSKVATEQLPPEVMRIAELLARIHGTVMAARETSGLHLYMASPACLEQDGEIELRKRHLAVNVDKYFGFGIWAARKGTYKHELCARCMKTSTAYTMRKLCRMKPIAERDLGIVEVKTEVKVSNRTRRLVEDGKGNMVPEDAGEVIPITQLPKDHPAVEYLTKRRYDLAQLEAQFNCGFCVKELPEDPSVERWFRRMPDEWKDTAQGRLIFYCYVHGVRVAWQARILEKLSDDQLTRYYWHPYREAWVPVETREKTSGGFGKWVLAPEYQNQYYEWNPSKYRTAPGSARNEILMGFDAALAWNKVMGYDRSAARVVLAEGPLDAGRVAGPAVALLGKSLSEKQARLLANNFGRVIVVGDNDKAGTEAVKSIYQHLEGTCQLELLSVPPPHKDLGDMSPEEADALLRESLTRS